MHLVYLSADDCEICAGMRYNRVPAQIVDALVPIPHLHVDRQEIQTFGDRFEMKDDRVNRKKSQASTMLQRIVDRRPDGWDGVATPMMCVLDPEYTDFLIDDLFIQTELAQQLQDDAQYVYDRIMRRILQEYLRQETAVDPVERSAFMQQLDPRESDNDRWSEAFMGAQQLWQR